MARETEAQLEVLFNTKVRAVGGITWKLAPTVAGIPDRLVIFPTSRMWLVELKTDVGQLSPIQSVLHDRLLNEFGVQVVTLFGRKMIECWVNDRVRSLDPDYDSPTYD